MINIHQPRFLLAISLWYFFRHPSSKRWVLLSIHQLKGGQKDTLGQFPVTWREKKERETKRYVLFYASTARPLMSLRLKAIYLAAVCEIEGLIFLHFWAILHLTSRFLFIWYCSPSHNRSSVASRSAAIGRQSNLILYSSNSAPIFRFASSKDGDF